MGEIMEKIDLKKIKQNIKNKPPKLILYGGAGIGKTTFASVFPSKPKRKNKKSKGIPKLITTRKR